MTQLLQFQKKQGFKKLRTLLSFLSFILLMLLTDRAAACSLRPYWIDRDSCTRVEFHGYNIHDSVGTTHPDTCLKYTWDFGDGSTGTGRVVAHSYATTGVYTICMKISDTCNSCDSTFCKTIEVSCLKGCMLPDGWIEALSSGYYEVTGKAGKGCLIYAWDFGDATFAYGRTVGHSYKKPGTYTVCMSVSDTCNGCDTTVCRSITIPPVSIKGIGKGTTHTSVYPNPASGSFTLNSSGKTSYKIFDAYGKMVSSGNFSDRIEISTNSLNNGIYIVQTSNDNQQEIQKLLIIK